MWTDGQLRHVFKGDKDVTIPWIAGFLSPQLPFFGFTAAKSGREYDGIKVKLWSSISVLLDDGERLHNVTPISSLESIPVEIIDPINLGNLRNFKGVMPIRYTGYLLTWFGTDASEEESEGKQKYKKKAIFIDTTSTPPQQRPNPVFQTGSDRHFTLGNIVNWVNPREAIAWIDDGYFVLRLKQENRQH